MNSVRPEIEATSPSQATSPPNRRRPLAAGLAVVAVVILALIAWAVYDQATETDVPPGVDQLLDDYLGAWEARDEAAVRAATTQGFVINEYIYIDDTLGFRLSEHIRDGIDGVVSNGFGYQWTNEHVGDPMVTGDGPWFVSVEENWEEAAARYEGQANYTIVEDDGVLKIANHYWAGIKFYPGN